MIKFAEYIFGLFPHYYKQYDSYKIGGKGLLERFLETLGGELDDETMKFLDEDNNEYYLNNLDPLLADINLLPHLMDELSNPPKILTDNTSYRKLLKYIVSLYKIRGTKRSYVLYFELLGFTIDLIEHAPDPIIPYIYDSIFIYDNGVLYDSVGCIYCSDYSIIIQGNYVITQAIINQIALIISFNEPINARMLNMIYAPTPLLEIQAIEVYDTPVIITEFYIGSLYDDNLLYDDGEIYDNQVIVQQNTIPIPN